MKSLRWVGLLVVLLGLVGIAVLLSSTAVLLSEYNNPDRKFFTFTGFHVLVGQNPSPSTFKVSKASMVEFPALNGQSVSYAVLQFPGGNVNPPHTHPRSSEVGFVDTTTNKLCTQSLQIGDVLVFPSGLAHFQHNVFRPLVVLMLARFLFLTRFLTRLLMTLSWLWPSRPMLPPFEI